MDNVDETKKKLTPSRTKELLIDVARQLFAHAGVEKTTMNDIAEASKRGRRTIYMYFRNKMDVFYAVVARELETLYESLQVVIAMEKEPQDKLLRLIYTHVDTIYEIVMRNGSLKANFFNDISKVERIRHKFDLKEQSIIASILREGNECGVFAIEDVETTALLLQCSIKGLEVPYINRQTHRMDAREFERLRLATEQMLFHGLRYNPPLSCEVKKETKN